VPPLRERTEDIPILVDVFLKESARQNRKKKKTMVSEALAALARYPWPGNVRELKNLVERLDIVVTEPVIERKDLPATYLPKDEGDTVSGEAFFTADGLKEARKRFEKAFIERKLAENDHNVSKTAEQIGVERSYLHRKIKKLG
jgi:two-component system nitrogen regulation response regulator NtrX